MPANRKYQILLVQLPVSQFKRSKHWGNVPLAAGFLKAMAYKERLLDTVDIEILSAKDTNVSSDAKLIDLIVAKAPDLIGFSLYSFNSVRSLFIAQEVKAKLPDLKIVIGGPEVSLETKYLLDSAAFDIGCLGEGELTFVEIIRHVLKGQNDYAGIKGIFYRKSGRIVATFPREPIKDLDQVPSPYVLGYIDPKDYDIVTYETIRGCAFKCAYCATGLLSMRYFSVDRIIKDLKFILERKGGMVRFVDGDFLLHPYFIEICERIKQINREKKLEFIAFTYAERISEEKADLLKACNFTTIETGLQSIRPETLKSIQRPPLQKSKFIAGVKRLIKRKISYTVDAMIGLPSDTFQDFQKMLQFLWDSQIKYVTPFVLQFLPGTKLAREAGKQGIKYQNSPPYLLVDAPYISQEEIKSAVILTRGKSGPLFDVSLTSYNDFEFPLLQRKGRGTLFKNAQPESSINKVILELDSRSQTRGDLEKAGRGLSRSLTLPFTAWFKTQNMGRDLILMRSFLSPIATSNPFLLWLVILESDIGFPVPIIERLRKSIPSREYLFDYCRTYSPIKILGLFPWEDARRKEPWLKDISKHILFYWSFNISSRGDWQKEMDDLFREEHCSGVLIDFVPGSDMDFIVEVFHSLYKRMKSRQKSFFFRNLTISYLFAGFVNRKERSQGISVIKPDNHDIETVLSIDRHMNISSALALDDMAITEMIACQIKFQKVFKASADLSNIQKIKTRHK